MSNIVWTSRNGYGSPRKKYPAVCASCKRSCEVPFKPSEDRDVFCHNCFKNNE